MASSAFRFTDLARELQIQILERCSMDTLRQLSLTSTELYDMTLPLLWQTIDFVNFDEPSECLGYQEVTWWQCRFLATCDMLRKDLPDRWTRLASCVQTLHLGRLIGSCIPTSFREDGRPKNDFDCIDGRGGSIFGVFSDLRNLRSLSIFLKNDWTGATKGELEALEANLDKLTILRLGGQIDEKVIRALLTRPEGIEELSLINLVDQCGQDEGPNPLLFLNGMGHKFTNLKILHLSLLDSTYQLQEEDFADPEDSDSPVELEKRLLHEWAALLRVASKTLQSLTLEIAGEDPDNANTENQCKNLLRPVFEDNDWPEIKRLVFIGMDLGPVLESISSRVQIEHHPGRRTSTEYDATPMTISPPNGSFGPIRR